MPVSTQYMSDYLSSLNEVESLDSFTPLLLASVEGEAVSVKTSTVSDFKRYGKMLTVSNALGSIALNMSLYDVFCLNLTGVVTLSVSNLPAPPYQFLLRIKQDGATSYNVTWPASFKFTDNIQPVLSTGQGSVDLFIGGCFEYGRVDLARAGSFK